MSGPIQIRSLQEIDPPIISAAFISTGANKPVAQYERYLSEQAVGSRLCLVAALEGQFAGYVTVNWAPTYPGFAERQIPEIQDLNVLPRFRRKGIGSLLLDSAEAEVGRRSPLVGIGVGLHPGYCAAQKLYPKRGYLLDGRGLTYRDLFIQEGTQVVVDDNLVLHFTKRLHP